MEKTEPMVRMVLKWKRWCKCSCYRSETKIPTVFYYWTLDGNFIIQNGNKLPVTGKDRQNVSNSSNSSNGTNGITPLLQVNTTANQWMISYDNGNSWQIVGLLRKSGCLQPDHLSDWSLPVQQAHKVHPVYQGFSIEEGDGIITVTYLEILTIGKSTVANFTLETAYLIL